MTMEAQYLTNQFLIAMPALGDPNFNQTVTYICEHTSEGALGIVINRPMNVKLGEILSQLAVDSVDDAVSDIPVLLGGPVQQDRGFVLHDNSGGQWDSSLEITSDIRSWRTFQCWLQTLARKFSISAASAISLR